MTIPTASARMRSDSPRRWTRRIRSTRQAIEAAALLHDTGKLAIPEHILNKPGKLTASEFETMKSHVDIGADILSSIDFPYPVIPIVRAHHECWNGSGYPAGLRGEEIPIGARILAVVDCFDALTSDRPYRPAMTAAEADAILLERRGTMYDPRVVDTFLRVRHEIPIAAPTPQLQKALGSLRRVRDTATRRRRGLRWRRCRRRRPIKCSHSSVWRASHLRHRP